jgi:hypothetical protein
MMFRKQAFNFSHYFQVLLKNENSAMALFSKSYKNENSMIFYFHLQYFAILSVYKT